MEELRESLRSELDCQVCYSIILDPLTIPCGHTFCRKCVARILDHSNLCPVCRRKIYLPSSLSPTTVNNRIGRLIDLLYPDEVAARREAVAQEESALDPSSQTVPLFVCALSFPTLPTFLHVFEPRYRLMIRRVLDSGGGKFGMVMFNRSFGSRVGDRRQPFMPYGTMLMIERFQLLPDGRSLLLATGLWRFKVVEWDVLNGYHVGKIERVDDVSLAEEESLEAAETVPFAASNHNGEDNEEDRDNPLPLESMSTRRLLQTGLDFVQRQRAQGSPWLRPPILLPNMPSDADRFPWWLASVLRISDEEKHRLLQTTHVRERLKIVVGWARKLDSEEWFVYLSLSLLFFFFF